MIQNLLGLDFIISWISEQNLSQPYIYITAIASTKATNSIDGATV